MQRFCLHRHLNEKQIMRLLSALFVFSLLLYCSCEKDSNQPSLTGQWLWTLQAADNPAYNSTPQSTGIEEMLIYNDNGNYSLTQNGIVINTGTYKTSTAKSISGQN